MNCLWQGCAKAAEEDSNYCGEHGLGSGTVMKVMPGDTLSKIAERYYGNGNDYMRIFYANRDKLNDPDNIKAGEELLIPPADN